MSVAGHKVWDAGVGEQRRHVIVIHGLILFEFN